MLIEESLLGWKEYELELMRDKNDNVVVVCPIENLDPMGVHTGDSITVAPTMTLSDREYQVLRDAGIAILRAVGVETGGSNVQFAINPADGRLVVIEMNPRVSRSSALASKATGFPIAKVAALLAVGYTLDEVVNDITQVTKAAFEPSIDYVVVKAPRFAFEKFKGAEQKLTTQMKSVGEAMAMGRTFAEESRAQGASQPSRLGLARPRPRGRRPATTARPAAEREDADDALLARSRTPVNRLASGSWPMRLRLGLSPERDPRGDVADRSVVSVSQILDVIWSTRRRGSQASRTWKRWMTLWLRQAQAQGVQRIGRLARLLRRRQEAAEVRAHRQSIWAIRPVS